VNSEKVRLSLIDINIDKETERQRGRGAEGQRGRKTERQRDREAER